MLYLKTDAFVARMCRDSFYQFFLEFWSCTVAEHLNPTWYIKLLCDELQAVSERVFLGQPREYDLIWNCPPGTTKSSVVSVLWQPWIWTRMPSARFISGSHSERLALDLSRKSRDVVLSEKYQALFPEVKLRDDQNTKGYFATTAGGFRYAVGVGGSVIGMHAHFIAVDDPINPQAALSTLELAEANTWMTETLSRRKVNVSLTPTVLIMQRLHQDDPTGAFLERGTPLKHFVLPAENSWEIKPPELARYYQDGLLDPVRLSKSDLEEANRTLLDVGFAGQYGQSPIPRGGAMFKVDLIIVETHPPTAWLRPPIRFWDRATSRGRGAYTVGCKIGVDVNKEPWILDIVRGQWDSAVRESKIDRTAEIDGRYVKQVFEQEPAASGKDSAEATVMRLITSGYMAQAEKATGDKELRADNISQMVNMGKCHMIKAHWNRDLIAEMRFFPLSKFKDQVDALSGGYNYQTRVRYRIGALRK